MTAPGGPAGRREEDGRGAPEGPCIRGADLPTCCEPAFVIYPSGKNDSEAQIPRPSPDSTFPRYRGAGQEEGWGGGGEAGLPVLRLITDHYGFAFESFYAQSFGARSPWGAVSSKDLKLRFGGFVVLMSTTKPPNMSSKYL